MNKHLILIVLLFSTLAGCVPSLNERYSKKLAEDDNKNIAKHSKYLKETYSGDKKLEARWAYTGILYGEGLSEAYDLTLKSLDEKRPLLVSIKLFHSALSAHLGLYSLTWSDAIQSRDGLNFSEALAVVKKEIVRIGVAGKVNLAKDRIKAQVAAYDKNKYPETRNLYSILSQTIDLANDPSGSLMGFNLEVLKMKSEFAKRLSLAELEH